MTLDLQGRKKQDDSSLQLRTKGEKSYKRGKGKKGWRKKGWRKERIEERKDRGKKMVFGIIKFSSLG